MGHDEGQDLQENKEEIRKTRHVSNIHEYSRDRVLILYFKDINMLILTH